MSAVTSADRYAYELWKAARARADEDKLLVRRDTLGFIFEGSLKAVALSLWPNELTSQVIANEQTRVLYAYLRTNHNAVCLDHSSQPPTWWIRDTWNGPDMPTALPVAPKPSPTLFKPPAELPGPPLPDSAVFDQTTPVTQDKLLELVRKSKNALSARDALLALGLDPEDPREMSRVCNGLDRLVQRGDARRQKRRRPTRNGQERRVHVYTPSEKMAATRASGALYGKITEVVQAHGDALPMYAIAQQLYGPNINRKIASGRMGHTLKALVEAGVLERSRKSRIGEYSYRIPNGSTQPTPVAAPAAKQVVLQPVLPVATTALSGDVDAALELLREALTAQFAEVVRERDELRASLAAIRKAVS